MSFGEIFRKSFLEGYEPADITTLYVVITLAITCAIATYIFLIYRLTAKKVFYSLSFNISLVATALITATIIFTIQLQIFHLILQLSFYIYLFLLLNFSFQVHQQKPY